MELRELVHTASTAPSADNSQPWKFTLNKDHLSVRYAAHGSGHDPFGPLGHGTLIAAGALLENLRELMSPDVNTADAIVDAQGWHLKSPINCLDDETFKQSSGSVLARHTNRHPFSALPKAATQSVEHNFSVRSHFVSDRSSIRSLTRALLNCSMARFNDPELHEWLFSSLRWTPEEVESGTGLDLATMHLPPGGRIFMKWIRPWERMKLLNKFGVYRILAAADVALFRQAPAIVAFVGGSTHEEILECGQLIQRTWIALNSQNIAVHPYYAITDLGNRLRSNRLQPDWRNTVGDATEMAATALQLRPNEQVHMLFRIGTPTVTPVRSKRLPLSAVLSA